MHLPHYDLKANNNFLVFQFNSVGKKGLLSKLIIFTETNLKGFYNLAFGDLNVETGKINDNVVSNNGDMEKVLATVVAAVYAFTDQYPNAWVYATGSNKARTRLYRIGISKHLKSIKKDFYIYGELPHGWEVFKRNKSYEGFAVQRKLI